MCFSILLLRTSHNTISTAAMSAGDTVTTGLKTGAGAGVDGAGVGADDGVGAGVGMMD